MTNPNLIVHGEDPLNPTEELAETNPVDEIDDDEVFELNEPVASDAAQKDQSTGAEDAPFSASKEEETTPASVALESGNDTANSRWGSGMAPTPNELADLFSKPGEGLEIVELPPAVELRKPRSQEFFRVHPDKDYRREGWFLEMKEERTFYVLSGEMVQLLHGRPGVELRGVVTCINRKGQVFQWPLRKGRDAWATSAYTAARTAVEQWTSIAPNQHGKAYEIFKAMGDDLPDPSWPDRKFNDMVRDLEHLFITSENHPVVRRLLGVD